MAKERSPNNNCKGGLVIVLVIPQDGLSENSISELEISIFALEVLDFEVENSISELEISIFELEVLGFEVEDSSSELEISIFALEILGFEVEDSSSKLKTLSSKLENIHTLKIGSVALLGIFYEEACRKTCCRQFRVGNNIFIHCGCSFLCKYSEVD
ncbi:hypothetical protein [Fischerella sp. PCC 9605]|uniref:hypothetical protein n=1 Tax=Fischerella sp. PCC 9605 TaxID=1173024 RepID=UPI0012DF96BA|nr:hypothetical protein [Fischerella sp. PCC 9605]